MRTLFWKSIYYLGIVFWFPHCVMLRRKYRKIMTFAEQPMVPWSVFLHTVSFQLSFIHFKKTPVMLIFGEEFPSEVRQLAMWVYMLETRKKS